MFSKNEFQQLSFNDSFLNMSEYLKKILQDSLAHSFQQVIFPAIDEDRFEVLYSDKPSRPNSQVNVIIGALILKEIFTVSINTFSNFRKRVYAYEKETGRKQSESKMSYGKTFNLDEDNLVTSCVKGEEPFYNVNSMPVSGKVRSNIY